MRGLDVFLTSAPDEAYGRCHICEMALMDYDEGVFDGSEYTCFECLESEDPIYV